MFNLQGSEIIILLLLALVVLGPEKLPGAIRRFTQTYQELRKMGTGFQNEFREAMEEPVRELRETADLVRDAADPDKIVKSAEDDAAKPADDSGPHPSNDAEPPNVASTAMNGAADGALAPPGADERPYRMAPPWKPLPPLASSSPAPESPAPQKRLPPPSAGTEPLQLGIPESNTARVDETP